MCNTNMKIFSDLSRAENMSAKQLNIWKFPQRSLQVLNVEENLEAKKIIEDAS